MTQKVARTPTLSRKETKELNSDLKQLCSSSAKEEHDVKTDLTSSLPKPDFGPQFAKRKREGKLVNSLGGGKIKECMRVFCCLRGDTHQGSNGADCFPKTKALHVIGGQ